MVKSLRYLLAFLLLPAFQGLTAGTIGISIHDSTVVQGNTISFPVYVDSSLTGQNVTAFQLQLSYSTYVFAPDTVLTAGTMSSSLGAVSYNSATPGKITIAVAGSTPLGGTGVLLYVRLKAVGTGYTSLSFTDAAHNFLNEGSPALTWRNGSINTLAAPTITVYPSSGTITTGDSLQFSVSGGTSPYHWSLTNGSVATIDSSGKLKATHAGFTKVIAVDMNGTIDTTNSSIEIRAYRLGVNDTSVMQGQTFSLPVYVTDLTGLNVTSGSFDLTFNQNLLSFVGVVQTGTLISSYMSPAVNTSVPGKVSISFAGSSPLSGAGVLIYVQFKVSSTNSGATYISPANPLFNETMLGNSKNGYFSTVNLANLYISPSTANVVAGETQLFSASGGTAPYSWSTTDSTVATITSGGLLSPVRGGTVNVKALDTYGGSGTSGLIQIYDTRVTIPDTIGVVGDTLDLPVYVGPLNAGNSVSSFQAKISYDSSVVHPIAIVNSGTLTNGWSYVPNITGNSINFAAAGSTQVSTPGVICVIRFLVPAWVTSGRRTSLTMQQFLLNEGSPRPLLVNGGVTSSLIALPSIPALSAPANGAVSVSTSPTLSWSGSAGATSYRLQVATDSLFTAMVYNSGGLLSTSVSLSSLLNLTKYYWRVNAGNSAGSSAWSTVWAFTTIIAAPPAPVLATPANGATGVALNTALVWNAATGATSYRLQVSTDASFLTIVRDSSGIAGTSLNLLGLANGTPYYWRVDASNAGGTGAWSGAWSFTTILAPPTAPTLASPANGAAGVALPAALTWNSSAGAASYRLQVSSDSTFASTELDTSGITVTSGSVAALSHATKYFWRVNASNAGGASAWSSVWNFITVQAPPTAPGGLSAIAAGFYAMSLSWTDNSSNESGFKIQRTLDTSTTWTLIATLASNSTSYSDTGLNDGTEYFYRVFAFNAGGNSGMSNVAQAVTEMRPPTGLTVSQIAGPKAVLSWHDSSSGETGFRVERKTGSGGSYAQIDSVGSNVETFTDSTVVAGQIYYYRVRGYNALVVSAYSNEVTLTVTAVAGDRLLVPDKYAISQNYPNPFNPSTTIDYAIPSSGFVELKVYDVTGRLVKTLVSQHESAGYYTVRFDGSALPSGVYFLRISANKFLEIKKMVLMK
jgi:Cohesin domain/Secretion system C-terminal sorting domain/Fibronectin type III domain/Bacterial Ig-like domain (group 2)